MPTIARLLGINLDYYFEILPIDIQKQYKNNNITLTGQINDFFVIYSKELIMEVYQKCFGNKIIK